MYRKLQHCTMLAVAAIAFTSLLLQATYVATAFTPVTLISTQSRQRQTRPNHHIDLGVPKKHAWPATILQMSDIKKTVDKSSSSNSSNDNDDKSQQTSARIKGTMNDEKEILGPLAASFSKENESTNKKSNNSDEKSEAAAATGTINDRLQAELEQAMSKETTGVGSGGKRSKWGKKLGLAAFKSRKTDAEREASIAEARDLNGVDPVSTFGAALVALTMAAALWYATQQMTLFFYNSKIVYPAESDLYVWQRVAAVIRNVLVGLVSLASGFFGVTGLGILLLSIRVGYGVLKGELDPTPISKPKNEQVELPNVWDLMLNKKPNRQRKKDDNSKGPFGL